MTGQRFTAEERDFKDFLADGRENGLRAGEPGERGEGLFEGTAGWGRRGMWCRITTRG